MPPESRSRSAETAPDGVDGVDGVDVAIVGAGFAGSAAAWMLLRERPELRVLLIERRESFDRGVGESTVEVSGHFLRHVLGLSDHLSRRHLPKQGLRFWFHDGPATSLTEASEVGPKQLARLPAWQVDREVLDQHVLDLAVAAGAELLRPARVRAITLAEEADGAKSHRIAVESDAGARDVSARYLIDASGRAAVIARPRGLVRSLKAEHPTASAWSRYTGVRDLDSADSLEIAFGSRFLTACNAPRRLATNHFTGYGYWIWAIPLQDGETSVGAVWDTRLVQPEGATPDDKLAWFLKGNPVVRRLMEGSEPVPGDVRGLGNLAYLVDRVAGPAWSTVGDAAGFLDPFYSPGLDQAAFSVCKAVELAQASLDLPDRNTSDGAAARARHAAMVAEHDVAYRRFLSHYFEGIYRDKYELLGDYDLMTTSMLVDTGMYYLTTVEPVYRKGVVAYRTPPFYTDRYGVGRAIVSFYRRRLVSMARRRRVRGSYGKRNRGRRVQFPGFALGWPARRMLLRGLCYWARAEFEHWRSYVWRFGAKRPLPTLPFAPQPEPVWRASDDRREVMPRTE